MTHEKKKLCLALWLFWFSERRFKNCYQFILKFKLIKKRNTTESLLRLISRSKALFLSTVGLECSIKNAHFIASLCLWAENVSIRIFQTFIRSLSLSLSSIFSHTHAKSPIKVSKTFRKWPIRRLGRFRLPIREKFRNREFEVHEATDGLFLNLLFLACG